MGVTQAFPTAAVTRGERMFKILNTPPGKIHLFGISILIFWVKKFSIIDRLLSLGQEMLPVEAEGDETMEVNLMLDEIHNPVTHLQKVACIIVEVKGDLDHFNEGETERGQSQMEKLMHQRLRDGENYSEKWIYVQENPLRKGLVQRIEDWPFKGRVFDLIWSGK